MPELLRPPPPITWSDRVRTALEAARERPARVGLAAAGAVVIAVAAALLLRTPSSGSAPALPRADALPSAATTTTTTTVVVDVAGAVARPGLVRLPGGSRVADAIDAVGGLLPTADRDRLNLAAPLVDGQRVYVPARGQDVPPDLSSGGSSPSANADAIVDLNTATVDDLDRLPGVGPATAQAILDYRRQHGRFRTIDELLEVRGIGEAKLNQLRPHVRV